MQKELILIVEDDLIVAKDMKEILEHEGYRVINNVTNYNVAIAEFDSKKPDLVLIDISLSDSSDGIDLANYIHKNSKTPFIYVTSHCDKVTLERVKSTRPYGYIIKPFRETDIITNTSLILNNFKHREIDPLRMEERATTEAPYRIRNVIDYINNNIYEKIEIAELAEMSKWKVHHFIRIFASIMGITPYKYILERKMEIARVLIETTNQPIQEISYDLNFQNYSNFYLAFKKIYKTSPESYRKTKQVENFNFSFKFNPPNFMYKK